MEKAATKTVQAPINAEEPSPEAMYGEARHRMIPSAEVV